MEQFSGFEQSKINPHDEVEHIEIKDHNLELLSDEELKAIASLTRVPGSNISVADYTTEKLIEFRRAMEENKSILGNEWSRYDGYAKQIEEILEARRILKERETSEGKMVH
jgi:hypothetical protein